MAFPSIKISIGAETGKLARDLKKGEGLVKSFGSAAANSLANLTLAAGAAAVAIGVEGVKAAIEDEAAQVKLAKTLQNTTHATKAQVKSVEDYINKTQNATGVLDDELRPSLDRLIRSTKDVTKAEQLQRIALDVSAGTGKDLASVTNAIAKAYDGNFGALKRLGVPLDAAVVKSKDFSKVQQILADTFKGQLAASLDTTQGKLKLLNTRWTDMKEQIGFVLLDGLQPLMDWASGPEGQKFLQDFMVAFKDAAVSVAKALPSILSGLKGIAKAASGLGIDINSFMDPKLLAAAAAFKLTPGPIQLKALAAIAAYASTDVASGDPGRTWNKVAEENISGKAAKALSRQGRMAAGGAITKAQAMYRSALLGNELSTGPAFNMANLGGTMQPQIVINVSGAVDPAATAKAVYNAMNKANRLGLNSGALGTAY